MESALLLIKSQGFASTIMISNNHLFLQLGGRFTDYSSPSTSLIATVEDSIAGRIIARRRKESRVEDDRGAFHQQLTIGSLPDDTLLEIFDFYLHQVHSGHDDEWHTLVHVCRRWRHLVFASPRRLDLFLCCSKATPARRMLDIWPPLPIIINSDYSYKQVSPVEGADNVIAALEHCDRFTVWKNHVNIARAIPELTHVWLGPTDDGSVSVLPDSFLASAPRLRSLRLQSFRSPSSRKLLLSDSHLTYLYLWSIPRSGYISPEAMVTCLSALTKLETFELGFRSPQSRPNRTIQRPPLTRVLLPALTHLRFKGVGEYLDDLVARIDAPLLCIVEIVFFNQLIFDFSHLPRFIGCVEKFKTLNSADLTFFDNHVSVSLTPKARPGPGLANNTSLSLTCSCNDSDWQLSSVAQFCTSSFPSLSAVECLDIYESRSWEPHGMENIQWMELLHPFTAIKDLRLSEELVVRVVEALQGLARESVTNVLPALQNLFLEGVKPSDLLHEAIAQFVAARQLAGHPVAFQDWRAWS
ncbi:hypothetical protein BJV74DRAFT_986397 [Russula compacta]|nr:hypothetical protein BJV74DRAFT_986397 [Russula compacta]